MRRPRVTPWLRRASRASLLAPLPLLFALACGPAAQTDTEAGAEPAPTPVQTEIAVASDGYEVSERFAGRVMARRRSDLGFERGGRVVDVSVDTGEAVEAGQILARLETRELRAQQRELEARVKETLSRLELAERTSERRRTLFEEQSLSEQAWDEARFEEAALRSSLEAARAGLERVRVALSLSALVAPYAGVVLERQVDEGTVVQPGQTLLRMIESGAVEFHVGLPPATARALVAGAAHAIEFDGGSREAVLRAVLPAVQSDTRTSTAIFEIAVAEGAPRISDGEVGHLAVTRQRPQPGFWVPLGALTESRRGLWSVFVVGSVDDAGTGVVERREVQVIHAEADRAFVRGTLQDGDRLVATGLHRIVQGQRVRPLLDLAADTAER